MSGWPLRQDARAPRKSKERLALEPGVWHNFARILNTTPMKTETTSTAVETSAAKQPWTEPTLTTLALSLETHAQAMTGGDGMGAGTNLT